MRLSRLSLSGAALIAVLALTACESPEERAESHYQRAVALLAEGQPDRAAIELRNSLQANASHVGARYEYAQVLRRQGDVQGAIGQFLRLVETDPDHASAHIALAELALEVRDVPGVERHAQRAYELAPDDPDARALKASLEFRRGESEAAIEMAQGVLADQPDNVAAHLVLIADRLAANDLDGALARADAAIEVVPDSEDLHLARLAALGQEDETDPAVGEQLAHMTELFPDNEGLRRVLLQWYLRQGDQAAALRVLRETAERDPASPEGYLTVAQFLLEVEGPDAARAELERLIASQADARPYRRALAQLDFAQGRRTEAIAALRILTEGEETSAEMRELQVALAQMLEASGQQAEAVTLIGSVLEADPRNVDALKMRARWHIVADQTDEALADLRAALTEAPRDPEIMTIMAMAHEREGATEQVGERLARAVEASNKAPAESIRYVRFLMNEDRLGQAESVALDALRRAPNNVDLLVTLGQVHLQRADWVRARQVAALLRDLGDPSALQPASALEIAALQGEGRVDDVLSMLEGLASEGEGDLRARVGLVQARIAAGDMEGAEAVVEEMLADDPEGLPGRMLQAALMVTRDDQAGAEAIYREVIAERPDLREPYQILFNILYGTGRTDEARELLEAGIAATNRDGNLLNSKAGLLYTEGDFAGAIEIYEELYQRNTANVVAANNLASVLSTYRDDPESLERAFQVARRLRGTEVPHFQDTYGWILVRRGDHAQALEYLEPAAAALTGDPLVQYHLGMAYLGLERWDEARAQLARAIEVAGEASVVPQIADARERIAEIDARPAAPEPAAN